MVLMWGVAVFAGLPLIIYSVEVAAGLRPLPPKRQDAADAAPTHVNVLIPAHDEELGIGQTVAQIWSVAPKGTSILVVADNCTDATADAARAAGADTLVRHDADFRGKSYALSYGRDYLQLNPPAVVIVVDADCRVAPGTIEALTAAAHHTQRPAQCVNLLQPDITAPPLTQLSNFAMLVKNLVRARGLFRLGGTTLLTGTGMAFPWPLFKDAPLASGNIVEDLELGLALTRRGICVEFVSGGKVSSAPAHIDDLLVQRRRWEIGFLQTATRSALPTLSIGLSTASRAALVLGLHMLVPPLVTVFLFGGCVLSALSACAAFGSPAGPAVLVGTLLALASFLTLIAWKTEGQSTVSGRSLLRVPGYMLWKLPIYLRGVFGRQQAWIRTHRRPE